MKIPFRKRNLLVCNLVRDLGKPGTLTYPMPSSPSLLSRGPLLVTDARMGAAWQSSVRRFEVPGVYLRLKKYGIEMGGENKGVKEQDGGKL